jgi:hypothetical protein
VGEAGSEWAIRGHRGGDVPILGAKPIEGFKEWDRVRATGKLTVNGERLALQSASVEAI